MIKFYPATSTKYRKQKFLNVYNQAFPENERRPLFLRKYCSLKKCVVFDDNLFVGLCVFKDFGEYIYVAFLAVEKCLRNRGIGSKILQYLKTFNKSIVLNVERMDYSNPNTLRRISFYKKNNFKLDELVFDWEGVELQPMIYGKVDVPSYLQNMLKCFPTMG